VEHVYVQRDARLCREALQNVRNHLAAQVADLLTAQVQLCMTKGARRQVDDRTRERLVQRRKARTEAAHAADRTESLLERLA